ncbi:MAG: GMC family oxidoreductase [Endozoicomonas sp.]|uniref:GMC family oxidoreductase n=1 Tax=Endozoicomonas sp. TaxID=1892382 RepID=UPI003D9AFF33
MIDAVDYIIIGAGSAGCVLANRLSACGKYQVLMLEAGGGDRNPLIHLPMGFSQLIATPSVNWGYKTEPEPFMNNRIIDWPRGRVVGGSSSINGMVYVRGQLEDFDDWNALGNESWSGKEVLPYFKKSEQFERGGNEYHGNQGEMAVSDSDYRDRHPLTNLYVQAANQAGLPFNDDYNTNTQEGITFTQNTINNGRRASTYRAFVKNELKERNNLTVITDALVEKIDIENGAASGVTFLHKGQRHTVKATRETLLAAGANNSPKILELSGVGRKDILEKAGVKQKHELKGVGENLQDHIQMQVVHQLKGVGSANDALKPHRLIMETVKYLVKRRGFLANGVAPILGFIKSNIGESRPDLQLHFAPAGGDVTDTGRLLPAKIPSITSTANVMRPESRGYSHIRSSDPKEAPAILANYLSTDHDRKKSIECVKWQRKIYSQSPLTQHLDKETFPGKAIVSDDEILDYIMREAKTAYHPVGTCKMGHDSEAVVDSRLKVHGIEKLRVIDASVMPLIPSANTNAATIMIAERGAEWVLAS